MVKSKWNIKKIENIWVKNKHVACYIECLLRDEKWNSTSVIKMPSFPCCSTSVHFRSHVTLNSFIMNTEITSASKALCFRNPAPFNLSVSCSNFISLLFQTLKSVWGWFIHSYVKMLTGAKFKNHNGAKRPADRRPQREGVFPGSWGQCRSYFKKTLFCFSVCDCNVSNVSCRIESFMTVLSFMWATKCLTHITQTRGPKLSTGIFLIIYTYYISSFIQPQKTMLFLTMSINFQKHQVWKIVHFVL